MPDEIARQLYAVATETPCHAVVRGLYMERIDQGGYSRDEDEVTHFCVYFLPYNPETDQIFLVHHKKSGLWIAPGGHVDRGESLREALRRELKEELGLDPDENDLPDKPFFLTITEIDNPAQTCRAHYDVWYLIKTTGTDFKIDREEFYETRWVDMVEARRLVIDPNNRRMLDVLETVAV